MDLDQFEAEKDAAFTTYCEKAREYHTACWERLQELLPSLAEQIEAKFPGVEIESEETEWTNNDTHFFDHWVRLYLPEGVTATEDDYFWLHGIFPDQRGVAIGFYSNNER